MVDGIYAALSGAIARGEALDTVANNLANVSTTGFKGQTASFEEVLAQQNGLANLTQRHVAIGALASDFKQGATRATGGPLDVAIDGEGFFVVGAVGSERLTRAGSFKVDPNGYLATLDGQPLLDDSGPIYVGEGGGAHISGDGTVWRGEAPLGHLRVVTVADPGRLERQGHNLWRPPAGLELEVTEPRLYTGALESSNVNAVEAMVELVWLSRAYETHHKAIEIFRSTDQRTVTDLGR